MKNYNPGLQLQVAALSDTEAKQVRWLWEPYIPCGMITILDGDPESGKTFLALAISAAVTTGQFIDAFIPVEGKETEQRSPGNVLYFTAEDGVGETIRPRFEKVGGQLNRFFTVAGIVHDQDGKEHPSPVRLSDVYQLENVLRVHQPDLVVFDPLQAFLGANVDMNRANEVRPVLWGVGQLAERYKCAILLIRHLNKTGQSNALYRGLGSIDMTGAARSVLLAGKNPHAEEGGQFVMAHLKCSLAGRGPSQAYWIGDTGLCWKGQSSLTADDLLQARVQRSGPRVDAAGFLSSFLAGGAKLASDVHSAAAAMGLRPRTLERASKELGIIRRPVGFRGSWVWELPSDSKERQLTAT